jgi:hypothetical protein
METEMLSLLALVIALTSTIINYLVLRSQRDPDVIVYALPDSRRPTIINLVIENIGKGRARDVRFEANRPIPKRAFGFDNAQEPEIMREGPLVSGIPAFASGEKRIFTWGQFGGLRKGLGDNTLEITATYKSYPSLRFSPKKHKTTSHIDIRSFEGTDASDQNWDKKAVEQLEQIAKALASIKDVIETSTQNEVNKQETGPQNETA